MCFEKLEITNRSPFFVGNFDTFICTAHIGHLMNALYPLLSYVTLIISSVICSLIGCFSLHMSISFTMQPWIFLMRSSSLSGGNTVACSNAIQIGAYLQQQLTVSGYESEFAGRITAEDVEIELRRRYQVDQFFPCEPFHIDEVVVVQVSQTAFRLVTAHLEQIL
uniref:Uncharacterized protein n=1 Tax=Anopheles culicifacies TaxID=139723 RepID=A0A182M7V9_9DIPT